MTLFLAPVTLGRPDGLSSTPGHARLERGGHADGSQGQIGTHGASLSLFTCRPWIAWTCPFTSPDAELLRKPPHLGVTLPRAPAQPLALRCLCWCLLTQRGECGGELVMGWGDSEHLGPSVSRLLLRCQVSGQALADPEVPRASLG